MTKQFSKEWGQECKTFLMRFFYHAKQRKAGTRGLKLDLCEINIFFPFTNSILRKHNFLMESGEHLGNIWTQKNRSNSVVPVIIVLIVNFWDRDCVFLYTSLSPLGGFFPKVS